MGLFPHAVGGRLIHRADDLGVRLQLHRPGQKLPRWTNNCARSYRSRAGCEGSSSDNSTAHNETSDRSGRVAAHARTLFRIRRTTSNGSAGLSIDGSRAAPVAPTTSTSASGPVSTRPPSKGSASTCSWKKSPSEAP